MLVDFGSQGSVNKSYHVSALLQNKRKDLDLIVCFGIGAGSWAMNMDSREWRELPIDDWGIHSAAYCTTGPSLLYIFGGLSCKGQSNALLEYRHNTEVLSEVFYDGEFVPPALFGSSLVQYNGKLYVYGGKDQNLVIRSEMYAFDLKKKSWEEIKYRNKAPGRCYHSMNIWVRNRDDKKKIFFVIYGGESNEEFNGKVVFLFDVGKIYRNNFRKKRVECT
jgi:N-acetylneuraminic acid mutarotase